ncbi:MAG: hypothetical protein LKJ17_11930 [Oscillospiraceae bacterium]|nr:hypothetical protein [Oscillospiraceae bacterium]
MEKAVSLVLVFALSMMVCVPAFASEVKSDNEKHADNVNLSESRYLNSAQKATSYITKNADGTLKLESTIKDRNLDNNVYRSLLESLQFTNLLIKNGYLIADTKGNLTITKKYIDYVESKGYRCFQVNKNQVEILSTATETMLNTRARSRSNSGGVTGIVYQWYGYDFYLNSTDANRVSAASSALAVASTLVPEPTASKALAVVFGASAAAISAANAGGENRSNY